MSDPERSAVVDLASQLVQIESENPPGNELACARFIADWFVERDIDAELIESPEATRPSVAARIGQGDPTLILNGHTDVVPVDDHDDWSVDPYGGSIEGGRLYGRGSADMKTGLALAMELGRSLAPELASTESGSLVIHAVAGEETGYPGVEAALDAGYGGDMGIVLEPTNLRVATRAKGVSTFNITIDGESSHASRPDQGTNPIDGMHRLLDAIAAYDTKLRTRSDPLCGQAFATVTEVEAGIEQNMAVIPNRASLLLDRRVLPGETLDAVTAEVQSLVDEADVPLSAEVNLVQHYASSLVDDDCLVAETVSQYGSELADVPSEPIGLEAATDARALVNDGIDTIIWGPGSLAQAHTVDEWISLDEVVLAESILEQSIRDLLDLDQR